jgi:hypothetical protein
MDDKGYRCLGKAKCEELSAKSDSLWELQGLCRGDKNKTVGGDVREGIARGFIREYLPHDLLLKPGLVFDEQTRVMSPQIDAIVYRGVPLLEFTDVAVVEKQQVRAIFEIKSQIDHTGIFGDMNKGRRNPNSRLISSFKDRRPFLATGGKYVLFVFELYSSSGDEGLIERLHELCDLYAIVGRQIPRRLRRNSEEDWDQDFDGSVGKLIKWLRTLA